MLADLGIVKDSQVEGNTSLPGKTGLVPCTSNNISYEADHDWY